MAHSEDKPRHRGVPKPEPETLDIFDTNQAYRLAPSPYDGKHVLRVEQPKRGPSPARKSLQWIIDHVVYIPPTFPKP